MSQTINNSSKLRLLVLQQIGQRISNRNLSIRIFSITIQWHKSYFCRHRFTIHSHCTHSSRLCYHIHIVQHRCYFLSSSFCFWVWILNGKSRDMYFIQSLLNRSYINHGWITKCNLCTIVFNMKLISTSRSQILITSRWARGFYPSTSIHYSMLIGLKCFQRFDNCTIHFYLSIIVNSSYTS